MKPNVADRKRQNTRKTVHSWPSPVATESTMPPTAVLSGTREIEFTILSDGRIVDLIKKQPSKLSFLVWQDGIVREVSYLDHNHERLVPPKIDPTVLSVLQLPTTTRSCPDVSELFTKIVNGIHRFVDIAENYSFLCTAFAVSTWFADRLAFAPYLSLCGPIESGKTTLQRALHCLCRRALHCSAITPSSVYRVITHMRPTLILDEMECAKDRPGKELMRLLRGGNRQGSPVLCGGKAFNAFGPKVIASQIPPDDAAWGSRTISIILSPSERDVPTLDLEAEQEFANTLQPMLQNFRLSHYKNVTASRNPCFLKFPPRLRDSGRVLAAGMLGNEELEKRLAAALESQTQSMQFDRFSEPEWLVMLALFRIYHDAKRALFVGGITDQVNEILRENGERHPYSQKKVGNILNKSLGFPTRRQGVGYRVETQAAGRKIHLLAKNMGIKYADIMPATNVQSGIVDLPCDLCSEFNIMSDHDGKKLLSLDEFLEMPCLFCGMRSKEHQCPSCGTIRQIEDS